MRFVARRAALGLADRAATSPLVRWSWTGPSDADLATPLAEFRPTDRESVLEMMEGRYLLSSKLIDTHGASPFSIDAGHGDWRDDLHAFDWLRHFRDARTDEERGFARSLALDWIGREGRFDRETWAPALTARRVLNWLRHYKILTDAATPEEINILSRALSTQVQSLKLRGLLAPDPVDALLSAIALVGVAVCDEKRHGELAGRLKRVQRLLDAQLDEQGLHRTRSARIQLMIMVELISIEQTLGRHHEGFARSFNALLESMHRALDAISLGTGEPAYFNGTGQLPHDIIVAVQAQSPTRARSTGVVGGYGRLVEGPAIVVADSGLVPPSDYARLAHAGALAFEFSHGRELVVCNCGPAPGDFEGDPGLFRQGITHSCPTINGVSASAVAGIGPLAGRLLPLGAPAEVRADPEEQTLAMLTHGYEDRFGVAIERRLTLIDGGRTLVGQDRLARARNGRLGGVCAIRFHLAHGTELFDGSDMLKLQLASGTVWSFMWEGARMGVEDSVRQSAYFGFHRTQQIVLEVPVADGAEASWIFTLDGE